MKLLISMLIAIVMFSSVLDAKSRSSSSRSSFSSRSSKSTGSFWGKSTKSKPKPVAKSHSRSETTKKSFSSVKPKPVAKPKTTVKPKPKTALDKKYAKSDNLAKSKYKNKATATKSYKSGLAKKNKYSSKIPPKSRPKHIPTSVTRNGKTVNVTYNSYGNGAYGYGCYNSMGIFVQLAVADMIVDNMMMRQAGYGYWDRPVHVQPTTQRHVVHHSESSSTGLIIILIIAVIFIGGWIIIEMKG